MSDVVGTLEIIQEYVDLAMTRRKRSITPDAKSRMEALDETLRDLIDGARPRPRRIEGTPVIAASTPPPGGQAFRADPNSSVARAKHEAADGLDLDLKPPAPKASSLDTFAKAIDVSSTDRKKMREVSVDQLPKSSYTGSRSPAFLGAYYAEDIVPLDEKTAKSLIPKRIVGTEGEAFNLSNEARLLFGLAAEGPRPLPSTDTDVMSAGTPSDARIRVPTTPTSANTNATPVRGRPSIVHLLQGGTRRGHIDAFDPSSGEVTLYAERGAESTIAIQDVLAIFFGLQKGEEPSPVSGQRVIVRLVNDRQVAGVTDDYQEGGDALTVMPEQRRGNVDRIWIPAWAVKEIQLG
jgi:hypothetical protein